MGLAQLIFYKMVNYLLYWLLTLASGVFKWLKFCLFCIYLNGTYYTSLVFFAGWMMLGFVHILYSKVAFYTFFYSQARLGYKIANSFPNESLRIIIMPYINFCKYSNVIKVIYFYSVVLNNFSKYSNVTQYLNRWHNSSWNTMSQTASREVSHVTRDVVPAGGCNLLSGGCRRQSAVARSPCGRARPPTRAWFTRTIPYRACYTVHFRRRES